MSASDMATVQAGGIESIRLTISRDLVERHPGAYDWSQVDGTVADAAASGLSILPTLYGSASWESPNWRTLPTSAAAIARWDDMLTSAVTRYGTNGTFWQDNPALPKKPITVWQIWNEVNTVWFASPIDAGNYADLVINSARTIRSADPNAKILLAGLYATPQSSAGTAATEYLKELYQVEDFRKSFDYAAIHPYEASVDSLVADVRSFRAMLDAWGESEKGIYITEMGWGSDSRTSFGAGTRAKQATRLTATYDALKAARSSLNLESVYWFTWKDLASGLSSCVFCYETGLFDVFRLAKPAWSALVDTIQRDPAPPDPVPSPGPDPVPSPGPDPVPSPGPNNPTRPNTNDPPSTDLPGDPKNNGTTPGTNGASAGTDNGVRTSACATFKGKGLAICRSYVKCRRNGKKKADCRRQTARLKTCLRVKAAGRRIACRKKFAERIRQAGRYW